MGAVPAQTSYRFDAREDEEGPSEVRKTLRRKVVSFSYGCFQAVEVVREQGQGSHRNSYRSARLEQIVPSHSRYAYDLIAYVGKRCLCENATLKEVHRELREGPGQLQIAQSSLYEMQQKFLFYLGRLHAAAAPVLKDYLSARPCLRWLVDGTVEPQTPVFFAVQEADEGILLGSWKMPSEQSETISGCFARAARAFGQPHHVYHDLSAQISKACESETFQAPHGVCHYHFARNVGEQLYRKPQQMLNGRLRQLKLMERMREQRKHITAKLRDALREKHALVLADLLTAKALAVPFDPTLARELLMALQLWILDYPCDGHRQGFPFDPYLLYWHRRVVRAHAALEQWLARAPASCSVLRSFFHLSTGLKQYLADALVIEAATIYENAFCIFSALRDALWLSASGPCPLSDPYLLQAGQAAELTEALQLLRAQYRQKGASLTNPSKAKLYRTVVTHLDKYWQRLLPPPAHPDSVRTTNELEGTWRTSKRKRRQTHGRKNLTRDFEALPEEYMLLANLHNPRYVELVLGSIDNLPQKLAQAAQKAPPFSHWRANRKTLAVGRLPKKLLRKENFLEELFEVCNRQDQSLNPQPHRIAS